ncbi:MAG: hypothetical protein M3Q07_07445 [Pseudobdellovibrionaceae bacterium]|nr:hypothetical protein [Pseudobdellovibrionaceae bacterium]
MSASKPAPLKTDAPVHIHDDDDFSSDTSHSRIALKAAVFANSIEKHNFKKACQEWDCTERFDDEDDCYCVCGVRIKENCIIYNHMTGAQLTVGNVCVTHFEPSPAIKAIFKLSTHKTIDAEILNNKPINDALTPEERDFIRSGQYGQMEDTERREMIHQIIQAVRQSLPHKHIRTAFEWARFAADCIAATKRKARMVKRVEHLGKQLKLKFADDVDGHNRITRSLRGKPLAEMITILERYLRHI